MTDEQAKSATIARLARECMMGNEMIAAGCNDKAAHMEAWEADARGEASTKFDFASVYNSARESGDSRCKALRHVARKWTGSRAEFVAAAEAFGVNKATAGTQWQQGRKQA